MTARQKTPESHRDIDAQSLAAPAGSLLVPQPRGPWQGSALDCCENEDGTEFYFYEGNEMQGHTLVYGPITAPAPRLVPEYDWSLEVWTWQPRTKQTTAEWWAKHPGNKANSVLSSATHDTTERNT